MKKAFLMVALAVLTLSQACKKDKNDGAPAGTESSWELNGTKHKVAYSNRSATSGNNPSTLMVFADAAYNDPKVNTFNVRFNTAPSASGIYQLVGGAGGTLTDRQCEVFAGSAANVYAYIGNAVDVKVDVSGGKIKITLPSITVTSAQGGADATLKATVTEK